MRCATAVEVYLGREIGGDGAFSIDRWRDAGAIVHAPSTEIVGADGIEAGHIADPLIVREAMGVVRLVGEFVAAPSFAGWLRREGSEDPVSLSFRSQSSGGEGFPRKPRQLRRVIVDVE